MRKTTGFTKLLFCFVLVAGLMVLVDGCDKAEDVGRKVMHKSGDLVGKGATEFFSGVGEGVDAVKWKGPVRADGDGQASVGIRCRQGSCETVGTRHAASIFACWQWRETCDCRLRIA